VPPLVDAGTVNGIALARDRRTAYVAVLRSHAAPALLDVTLASGASRTIASGISPAVSPDGRRLAYLATEWRGYWLSTGLAVRDLATGATRTFPLPAGAYTRSPLNWSPDGKAIAVYDGTRIRLVELATALDVASQPGVPGDEPNHPIEPREYPPSSPPAATIGGVPVVTVTPPPPPTTATSTAPVYLDHRTVVAVYDCCIGYSHLVAFDLVTGERSPFATTYGPAENISRIGRGRLLVVTAAGHLVVATNGDTRLVAKGIAAAAG
jgi:sugar lactone lactonase YvrE